MEYLRVRYILRLVGVILLVLAVVWGGLQLSESEAVREIVAQFGYIGVLIIAAVSGFNVLVPIPAVALLPLFTASGLSFWPVIIIIALGMTLGDSIGYAIGAVGRDVAERKNVESRWYTWLCNFQKKHTWGPYVVLALYASFAPAPNELIVIPMSFMGYPMRIMIPIMFVGNLIFNTLAALGIFALVGLNVV